MVYNGGTMEQEKREIKRVIPRELWRRARAQAILQDKPLKQWLCEAIQEKIDRSTDKP